MEEEVGGPGSDLAWRVERACFHAWPALHQVEVGDWVARAGAGLTRRNNSANPLRPDARLTEVAIAACESLYDGWGLRRCFRLPGFLPPETDRLLERCGYAQEADTTTLFGQIPEVAAADPSGTVWSRPEPPWLNAKAGLSELKADEAATYRSVLETLTVPAGFAGVTHDGVLASVAYGAIYDRLLCLEGVVTRRDLRGQGLGRRMLMTLFAWARDRGAEAVCLQVESGNASAVSLYRSLGLRRDLYHYHYRRWPSAEQI